MRFKIGEASRLLGVSTQTIRAYEQAGILTPHRSENGTRYFEMWQLLKLMSFKKYRDMGMSISQVVDHFRDDRLPALCDVLEDHAARLRAEANRLIMRADAVDAHRRIIDGVPYPCTLKKRPAQYRLDDLEDVLAGTERLDVLADWLHALPVQAISPLFPADQLDAAPTWGLFIAPDDAALWGVDVLADGVSFMPSVDCVEASIVLTTLNSFGAAFAPVLRAIHRMGHTLDPGAQVWGRQIASETVDGVVTLHYLFWFPVLSRA